MNQALEIAAVSLRAQQRALETMANNIANVNTPAFKRSDVIFAEVVGNGPAPVNRTEEIARNAMLQSGGVHFAARDMISLQGEMRPTGNALDIAVDGRGFIELAGPDGQTWLWRGGRLTVNRDGYLAAADGGVLQSLIAVPDDASELTIGRDGVVAAKTADGDTVELGQIMLVRVDSDASLERAKPGLYRTLDEARVTEAVAGEDGTGTIEQGMTEESNVDFSAAMVQLLMIQRAYAANAQVVQAADQISSLSNNLKR
ncbi:flagellar hook-basal body protein [Sphingopyxis sp.]|uniref:flagellar hook-basal body protein n=1 Tax=Sphingopyxis sp. TaxID=1908224 RepID=UPI002FC97F89